MKEAEKQRLDKNWEYAKKLWFQQKKKHHLEGWGMRRVHATDKAGMCSYDNQKIYISTYFLRGHNCDYEKVKKILFHEIAHALRPGDGHNLDWKKKCRELGGDTRLSVTVAPHGMNWAAVCVKCKWRHEFKSKPNFNGKICAKCHSTIKVFQIK